MMRLNNIHLSYLARFLCNLMFFGAVTIPYFIDWLHVDYIKIAILQTWCSIWIVLLEVPTGFVADKYGRKISLALGCIVCAAAMLIYGLTQTYWHLFIAEFAFAVGFTLISGADKAILYDSLVEQKKTKDASDYLSRLEAAGTLGIVIGMPLGSLFAGSGIIEYPRSLPATFLITAAVLIIAGIVYLTMREPRRKNIEGNFLRAGIDGVIHLKRHPALRAFTLNTVLISAATFFIYWLYQPLSQQTGISVSYLGFVSAGFNIFAMLLLLNVKKLERAFGVTDVLFYSAVIPGLTFIALAFFRNAAFIVIGISVIAALRAIRRPMLEDFTNRHIESKNRATVLSGISMMGQLVIAVMYPIVGALADISLAHALVFLGGFSLVFAWATRIEEHHLNHV